MFLGGCEIPEDACGALISADSFSGTDPSPCEGGCISSSLRSCPEEQLSDPPLALSGVLSFLSLSRVGVSHLHCLCAVFQPELWLHTKSLMDQFPKDSTFCVLPTLLSLEQGYLPRGMSLLQGTDRIHRLNPSVLLGCSPTLPCSSSSSPLLCHSSLCQDQEDVFRKVVANLAPGHCWSHL